MQPAPFVKVTKVQRGTVADRKSGIKSAFYVHVTVSTEQIGEHAGRIAVEIGPQKTTIPVKVNVLAPDASATSVLIVQTPYESSSTDDASVFDPWLRLVESATLDPHYLDVVGAQPVLRQLDLSKFDVILLGEHGLLYLLDSDIAKLKQFVNDGGRLLVCANYFFRGTVDMANKLLVSAGLRNVLFSGLYFSISGAVCYSRQIDETLRSLMAKGMLVLAGRDPLVVRDDALEEVRGRLRKKLPSPAYRSLQAASKWFYGKMFPDSAGPRGLSPG